MYLLASLPPPSSTPFPYTTLFRSAGSVNSGFGHPAATLNFSCNIFKDHNGIIHYQTQRKGTAGEGDNVEASTGYIKIDKSANSRERDDRGKNEGRPASQQKAQNHYDYEDRSSN